MSPVLSDPAIITLTTDFGEGSPYIAQMKGVILSINPRANLVDLTHAIPPQDVRHGALVLDEITGQFPVGSIHVAVVDPGVGTERKIVYACMEGRHYIAPDNGLLSVLASRCAPTRTVTLENSSFWLPEISTTFHGRDIMAPVAAHVSLGVDPQKLGPTQAELVPLQWPAVHIEPRKIEGSVLLVDSFGNLITDVTREMLAEAPTDSSVSIRCASHETRGVVKAYGERPAKTLLALIGSGGRLELSIAGNNAAETLGAHVGVRVTVTW